MNQWILATMAFISLFPFCQGQDNGPLNWALPPAVITVPSFYYVNRESNLSPSRDVALDQGVVNVDAYVFPVTWTFSLNDRLAQIYVIPAFGSINGSIQLSDDQVQIAQKSGIMDANLMFRLGLLNAPALNMTEYIGRERKLQVSGILGITVPIGNYEPTRRVNLGANRWAFRLGLPVVIPLNQSKKTAATLEITPNMYLFTNNNEPVIINQPEVITGELKTQKPLFMLEQHLTKFMNRNLWSSLDFVYQYGGQTNVDGIEGNIINQFSAGLTIGYRVVNLLILQASIERLWYDNTKGRLFRIGVSMVLPSASHNNPQ